VEMKSWMISLKSRRLITGPFFVAELVYSRCI